MRIGFTGTQRGMTVPQMMTLSGMISWVINKYSDYPDDGEDSAHHGDCIGADAQFHEIIRWKKETKGFKIHIHSPTNTSKQAFCQGDVWHNPKPYMERNDDIVRKAEFMFGAPGEMTEELRSGTWATIRRARKARKNLWIVYPDGTVLE